MTSNEFPRLHHICEMVRNIRSVHIGSALLLCAFRNNLYTSHSKMRTREHSNDRIMYISFTYQKEKERRKKKAKCIRGFFPWLSRPIGATLNVEIMYVSYLLIWWKHFFFDWVALYVAHRFSRQIDGGYPLFILVWVYGPKGQK